MITSQYRFLSKNKSEILAVISPTGMFIILVNKRHRQKILRDTKVFIAKVYVVKRDWDTSHKLDLIRQWWQATDDDALFERLNGVPLNTKVAARLGNELWVEFNVIRKGELIKELFLDEKEPVEQDD